MDFLWLFIFYVLFLVLCISAFCFLSGRSNGRLNSALHRAEQVIALVLPERLQRCINICFNSRSGAFVILHLVLDALVFIEYTWEIIGYSLELDVNWMLVYLPYFLITVNLYFFYKCCTADPGRVTEENEAFSIQAYVYDEVMFHKDKKCTKCDLVKPARSKHCGVCGSCIQRFDHHCVWVNNCIGALNIGYFLLYLLSLTLTAASLATVITAFLLQVVLLSHMMTAAYVDSEGHEEVANLAYVIQHLFLTFPRIVFTLGFLFLLLLFLGGYTCFIWYLSIINRTTREWYKARKISRSPKSYSRGFLGNMKEVFQSYIHYRAEETQTPNTLYTTFNVWEGGQTLASNVARQRNSQTALS